MIRLRVTARVDAPLVLARQRQSHTSRGLDFIPGPAIRGALAANYLLRGHPKEASFRELFLDEERTRFSPLYPGERVFPLTAVSCKRESGFRAEDRHGVRDLLLLRLARFLQPRLSVNGAYQCPGCGQEVRPLEGFYTATQTAKLRRSVVTHVGIDRATSTAAPGVLYTQEEIDSGQHVYGSVVTTTDLVGRLQEICAMPVRVGAARTRGKGRLMVDLVPEPPAESAGLIDSWRQWNQAVHRQLAAMGGVALHPGAVVFALTLHSETICVDRFLRPTADLSFMLDWLPPALPGAARSWGSGQLQFVAGVLKVSTVRGWHAAHGLPRGDDQALARGSVFAYRLEPGSAADVTALYDRLVEVQRQGVGLRRNEGFGMVEICDAFHVAHATGEGEPHD